MKRWLEAVVTPRGQGTRVIHESRRQWAKSAACISRASLAARSWCRRT